MESTSNILFIADIIGPAGFEIISSMIDPLREKYNPDLIIVNGENAAGGKGLTPRLADDILKLGVDVITSGNHIWDKNKIYPVLNDQLRILRPMNYPSDNPGHGSCVVESKSGNLVGVINLQGRSFMYPIDCPFETLDRALDQMRRKNVSTTIVDFHAEASAEKLALGWHADGRITALIGTHTHVQTADEKILPGGTAYLTDAGMTGSFNSVIGMHKYSAIKRFKSQMPVPYQLAEGDYWLNGAVISMNHRTGKAGKIERLQIPWK